MQVNSNKKRLVHISTPPTATSKIKYIIILYIFMSLYERKENYEIYMR